MSDWKPADYLRFADERARPARDLLAQVPLAGARNVYDLGCGPGNSTALLVDRFPDAQVTGVDNSPAMLSAARKACPTATFAEADLVTWVPEDGADLLFSNATFQWLPDPAAAMQRLIQHLPQGGVLAVQVPDNLGEPSHRLMQAAAGQGPWRSKLVDAGAARGRIAAPWELYRQLRPHLSRLDIWHSVYNHPVHGVDGIIAWLETTGLRPFLDPLDVTEREGFLACYRAALAEAYPALPDGTVLLRFPRLFLVGVR